MKLNLFLLFCILTILASCNGQNATKSVNDNPKVIIGDTISKLSNNIWMVFQATNGDYWFGSDTTGIYRYDGKTIINFSTKHGLNSNRARGFQEDKQGNIFITTIEGINKFDGYKFTSLNVIKSKSPDDNWRLQNEDLWFCILGKNGEKGPYRYDGKNLYQLEFPKHYMADAYFERFPNNSWSPYDVYYIYKDSKGTMWFGTSNFGVCRYDGKSLSWLYEDHLTNTPKGGSFGIRSILEDAKGKYWFCNTRFRYNIAAGSIIDKGKVLINYEREKGIDGLKSEDGKDYIYFMSAIKDDEGNIWMATYNQGVWRYDGKEATHYPVKEGSKDITLFSIYKDKKGELWLGSHETSLYKFNGTSFVKFKL